MNSAALRELKATGTTTGRISHRETEQSQVEDTYSRRSIRQHVIADIDTESSVFLKCIMAITKLFAGTYYESKMKRLSECQETVLDIATELFIAVLPIKEISPIQAVAAQLGNRLGYTHLLDAVKTASEIIAVCEISGLYTLYHSMDHDNKTGTLGVRANYCLSPEVMEFIDRTMYLPPMLCRPMEWKNNTHGGYIHGTSSVVLGSINHHNKQQDLDALNTIQDIAWELNTTMLEIEETPNKPLDTDEKQSQFDAMKDMSRKVYDSLVEAGNMFYFVWKYDKRGRMYSQGYHVNLQSTQYKKAILQFKHKELLT